MRTLACVIAASIAAASLLAAVLDPAVWHLGPAVAVAAVLVAALAIVQWRATRNVPAPPAVRSAVSARRAGRPGTGELLAIPVEPAVPGEAAPYQYWTPALDRRLLALFDDRMSSAEIAIRMRRDRDTVELRLVQLLIEASADFRNDPVAPRNREPMSEAEASYLRAALDRGETLHRMARAVGRTRQEVGRFLVGQRRLTIR